MVKESFESTTHRHYPLPSILCVLIAGMTWATTGPVVRWMALPALWVCAVRFVLPAFMSAALVIVRREYVLPSKGEMVSSFLNAFRTFCFVLALAFTPVTNSLPILFSWPIFSMIFGRVLFGEHITRNGLFGTVFCMGGVLCVFGHAISLSSDDLIGVLLMLAGASAYGIVNVLNKRVLISRTPLQVVFSQNLFGAFCFLPAFLMYDAPDDPFRLVGSFYYGLAAGMVGFLFYFTGLRSLPTQVAAALCYFELLFSFVLSSLFLDEHISLQGLLGAFLIVLGTWIVRRPVPHEV